MLKKELLDSSPPSLEGANREPRDLVGEIVDGI